MNNSSLYSLNKSDFINGIITSIFSAVVTALYELVSVGGFSVFTANWGAIAMICINVAGITAVGYIARKFTTDSNGKLMGLIG